MNTYLTFSFVRHPFDRIVSAYKDKAEDKGKNYELKLKLDKIWESRFILKLKSNLHGAL